MAITIHERAVRYFSRHEQPDMANIAHERADRARDALPRAWCQATVRALLMRERVH
jgi:hypothetical protein